MWELDHKEGWVPKNWCFWVVLLEKTLESPLDCKEIKPVRPKGNHPWIFIGRTDVEAETPILWSLDVESWLIWNNPNARKDWRKEEKGTIEDEMVEWHHRLNGREFEQALGVGNGQGGLACCGPWVTKSQTRLKWFSTQACTDLNQKFRAVFRGNYWGHQGVKNGKMKIKVWRMNVSVDKGNISKMFHLCFFLLYFFILTLNWST